MEKLIHSFRKHVLKFPHNIELYVIYNKYHNILSIKCKKKQTKSFLLYKSINFPIIQVARGMEYLLNFSVKTIIHKIFTLRIVFSNFF